jgi:drug/metabolite transporter (DMT)-like permease
MHELVGVLAGMASNGLGGTAVAVTRYAIGAIDPITLGAFRFGVGFIFLLPVAVMQGGKWPPRADWRGVLGLGLLFFAFFPILFNAALMFTTATRGALALSIIPLISMVVGAILGVEALTARKTVGAAVAVLGVAIALVAGSTLAPDGAWRGDLLMLAGAFCFAEPVEGSHADDSRWMRRVSGESSARTLCKACHSERSRNAETACRAGSAPGW